MSARIEIRARINFAIRKPSAFGKPGNESSGRVHRTVWLRLWLFANAVEESVVVASHGAY